MKTKKTFKAVIAMALALILSLGAMSAAFAANDSITWTVYDETASCAYHSDLALGTNTVAIKEGGYYYFDLSELENGYYSVEITDSVFEYFCVPEKSGNKYVGWGDGENFFSHDVDRFVFNRNEKTDVAIVGAYGAAEAVNVEVEYLGEDIESVELNDENIDELILHYDIMEYGTEEYGADFDTVVTFTSGKTLEEEGVRYWFDYDGGLKKGENTVTLEFAGHEFEQKLNVALISDYISGVEVEGSANARIYYNGYSADNAIGKITVVFSDNTKQTIEYTYPCKVTLPNGREIELDCMYAEDVDELKVRLVIGAGSNQIAVIDLETEKASISENISRFAENIGWYTEYIESEFEQASLMMKAGMIQEAMAQYGYAFRYIGYTIGSIFNEIGAFVSFMFK